MTYKKYFITNRRLINLFKLFWIAGANGLSFEETIKAWNESGKRK